MRSSANQRFWTDDATSANRNSNNNNNGGSHMDLNLYRSYNLLDVHVHYINMLQQTGLYRDLSLYNKWHLMCTGQRISIRLALHSHFRRQQQRQFSAWEQCWYQQISKDGG